ncbi:MAG: hypothetical protein WA948_06870 [Pontixanthobacter sp.]
MPALDRQPFGEAIEGGWCVLVDRGCHAEAAELIREWRHEKRDYTGILFWHEGQLRAEAAKTAPAIAPIHLTYKSAEEEAAFG